MDDKHGVLKTILVIVAFLAGLLLIGFLLIYKPNRALEDDVEEQINYELTYVQMLKDVVSGIDVGKETEVIFSEDVINSVIYNQLENAEDPSEDFQINYLYVDLQEDQVELVTHIDLQLLGTELPTIVTLEMGSNYNNDVLTLSLESVSIGSLPIPNTLFKIILGIVDMSFLDDYGVLDTAELTYQVNVEEFLTETSELFRVIEVTVLDITEDWIEMSFMFSLRNLFE